MKPRYPYTLTHTLSQLLRYALVPTIAIIGVVFTAVVVVLAWLLWVPSHMLLLMAGSVLPVGLAVGVLETLGFPFLVRRLRQKPAGLLQGAGHLMLVAALSAVLTALARYLGQPFVWPVPPTVRDPATWYALRVLCIYALAVFITTLVRQLVMRTGPRQLLPLLMGHYQQPVTETRLFLFVDLKDSTRLAEQLGNDKYSRLVRDFFRDVSPAIAATGGQVYQYVGDEVVVTWLSGPGRAHANCLRCFFAMQRAIQARSAYYQRTYQVIPEFKAGAHGGQVTTVLVGTTHQELVHHGDVLNTTARIQARCNALGSQFLISDWLRVQLGEQPAYRFTLLGDHALRGKAGVTTLLDVQQDMADSDGGLAAPRKISLD